jgi:hypothetical protein
VLTEASQTERERERGREKNSRGFEKEDPILFLFFFEGLVLFPVPNSNRR